MSGFRPGDRVRWESTGDDGFPVVRYGFVGRCDERGLPEAVLLDDELSVCAVSAPDRVVAVAVTTVELRLDGADLLEDPCLRRGLVELWAAEAEAAGLEVRSLHHVGDGVRDSSEGYVLAEMVTGGEQYVLRATRCHDTTARDGGATVRVRADRPNRWDL